MGLLPVIITCAATIFGSVGLWTYADHRKQHEEAKEDKQEEILAEVQSLHKDFYKLNARMDKRDADDARNRILRFADELRRQQRHSEEFFNQILEDINDYRAYCDEHPEYKNSKADDARKYILEVYHEVKANNEFI